MKHYRISQHNEGQHWYIQRWRWWGWRWEDAEGFSNPYATHWMALHDLDCYMMGVS